MTDFDFIYLLEQHFSNTCLGATLCCLTTFYGAILKVVPYSYPVECLFEVLPCAHRFSEVIFNETDARRAALYDVSSCAFSAVRPVWVPYDPTYTVTTAQSLCTHKCISMNRLRSYCVIIVLMGSIKLYPCSVQFVISFHPLLWSCLILYITCAAIVIP